MLGIRLSVDEEAQLDRFAREAQRPKSVIARDWIMERLNREAIDRKIRDASYIDADERRRIIDLAGDAATDAWMRWLDAEDGGYDWGPDGPPA